MLCFMFDDGLSESSSSSRSVLGSTGTCPYDGHFINHSRRLRASEWPPSVIRPRLTNGHNKAMNINMTASSTRGHRQAKNSCRRQSSTIASRRFLREPPTEIHKPCRYKNMRTNELVNKYVCIKNKIEQNAFVNAEYSLMQLKPVRERLVTAKTDEVLADLRMGQRKQSYYYISCIAPVLLDHNSTVLRYRYYTYLLICREKKHPPYHPKPTAFTFTLTSIPTTKPDSANESSGLPLRGSI
ncbi:hypothetical protein CBL_11809 [Carabus blaptoides fortunei]